MEIGRNDPCPCGSGKKYKKCHLEKDQADNRRVRETAALNAAKVATETAKEKEKTGHRDVPPSQPVQGGWMKKMAGKMGFMRGLQRHGPPQNKGG